MSRLQLTGCFLFAWIAGLAGMAGIQMFDDPGLEWFGVLMLMGVVISALPAGVALTILLVFSRRIGDSTLPFALLGPPVVIVTAVLLKLDVFPLSAQATIISSIVFYAITTFRTWQREPDPY